MQKAASELAQKAGAEKLALLQSGKPESAAAGLSFGKSVTVNRNQAQADLPPAALAKVFQADPAKLPAYASAVNEAGGYSIYKVVKVIDTPTPDTGKLGMASTRVGSEVGRELLTAYLASLKADADVKLNQAALEKK
jgi:peptidyl-prolyl cis-trans isomerase D